MTFISNRARARMTPLALAALALTAVGLRATPAHAAATLAITAAPDPVAGIPTQLGATGSVSGPGIYHLVAERYKLVGTTACASTWEEDEGEVGPSHLLADGPFAEQGTVTFDRAGDYLVCAWLTRGWLGAPEEVLAARSGILRVRAPRLALAVAATPTAIVAGQSVQVAVTAQAEVERALYVYGVTDVGRGCPANAEAAEKTDGAFVVVWKHWILGGPTSTTTDVTLERLGTRLLCGYLQREYLGDPSEAVAQAAVTVVAPPPPCVVPAVVGESLAAASDRIRGASCAVGPIHYEPSARSARGTVFKLAPLPGASLANAAPVDLWVSTGAPCVVPALPASRTLAVVRRKLAAAGCTAGRITHRRSASVRRGRVVALGKPRGTRLAPRGRVAIVVSRGPA